MANNYINVIKTLTGTSATGVYTVPDDKVAIVKTLSAYNTATGAATSYHSTTDRYKRNRYNNLGQGKVWLR